LKPGSTCGFGSFGVFHKIQDLTVTGFSDRRARRRKEYRRRNAIVDIDAERSCHVEIPIELSDIHLDHVEAPLEVCLTGGLIQCLRKSQAITAPVGAEFHEKELLFRVGCSASIIDTPQRRCRCRFATAGVESKYRYGRKRQDTETNPHPALCANQMPNWDSEIKRGQ
jgi:hypothetical protein